MTAHPPASDAYLWVDLETASLNPAHAIFEIGAILTFFDGERFVPIDEYQGVVLWESRFENQLDAFTLKMHTDNGLLRDMGRAMGDDTDFGATPGDTAFLGVHDENLANVIGLHLGSKYSGNVHLAGSGVSHFDLRRVNDQMPNTAGWLHWRPLDVGQLEEWRKLLGKTVYDDRPAMDPELAGKTHRAMDDIRFHLAEANWYVANALKNEADRQQWSTMQFGPLQVATRTAPGPSRLGPLADAWGIADSDSVSESNIGEHMATSFLPPEIIVEDVGRLSEKGS